MDENGDTADSMLCESLENKQTRAEKVELRRCYRKLIQETQENKEELIKPDNTGLMSSIAKADELFTKVKETREAALDARFMSLAVSIGAQKTSLLQTDLVAFQPDEFIQKLITLMDGRQSDDNEEVIIPDAGWKMLGNMATNYFTSITPALHPLSGALEGSTVIKQSRTSRQADDTKNDKAQVAQHLTNYSGEKKEATPEEIERVFKIIRGIYARDELPIDYFELVINPNSFGHTIENIFHVAFLVKDGLVKISLDENGLPVVKPLPAVDSEATNEQTLAQGENGKEDSKQVIVSLSHYEWRQLIEAYELEGEQPCIPAS